VILTASKKKRAPSDGGLRPMFRNKLRDVGKWTTIETGFVTQGVPDSYLLLKQPRDGSPARSVWVEHKQTDGWKIGSLKKEQVAWCYDHWLGGGAALFAVRRWCDAGPRREQADELYLVSGEFARELFRDGIQGAPHLLLERGGPAEWSWSVVRWVLESQDWLAGRARAAQPPTGGPA